MNVFFDELQEVYALFLAGAVASLLPDSPEWDEPRYKEEEHHSKDASEEYHDFIE